MNDILKVLLGVVLLCIIPIACLALAGLAENIPAIGRLLDRFLPENKDPK